MNRCQNNFEGRRKECHRIFRAAGTFGEKVGLTAEFGSDSFFADRGSDNGADASCQSLGARGFKIRERALAGCGARSSPLDTGTGVPEVLDEQNGLAGYAGTVFDPAPLYTGRKP